MEDHQLDAECRYATPTFSSSLSKYNRGEAERIRNTFRNGSMCTLRELPTTFAPGKVDDVRNTRIIGNLNSKPAHVYKAPVLPHCFSKVQYYFNDYTKESDLRKCNIEEERVKIDCWSRKPFNTTSRLKLKHEEVFCDSNYKFLDCGGPTGIPKLETIVRPDLNDSKKYLNGQFHSYVKKERLVSKGESRIWAKQIYEKLSADWSHLRFKVKFTESDELLVCFPILDNHLDIPLEQPEPASSSPGATAPEPEEAGGTSYQQELDAHGLPKTSVDTLCRYMKHLATHGLAFQIGLKRRGDRWRRVEVEPSTLGAGAAAGGQHMFVFSFYAPWVKVKRS